MKKTKEDNTARGSFSGTVIVLVMALMNMLLGALMLLVPQIEMIMLTYVFITILIVLGISLIIKYFMTGSYENLNQYGFSVGVLFVILGMCALVRAEALTSYFVLGLGIWILASAIVKLQYALDLKSLDDSIWLALLIVAAVLAVCAVVIIINPFSVETYHTYFTYIMLVADGAFSLISTAYLSLRIKKYHKKRAQVSKVPEVGGDDTVFEGEPQAEDSLTQTPENKKEDMEAEHE